MWGTLFPILSEAWDGNKIYVGASYFNQINIPIGLVLLFLMGIGPLLSWNYTSKDILLRRFKTPSTISFISGFSYFLFSASFQLYVLVAIMGITFTLTSILGEFYKSYKKQKKSSSNIIVSFTKMLLSNRHKNGGYIVHIGIVLIFVGFIGRAFEVEKEFSLAPGEQIYFANYTFKLNSIESEARDNHYAVTFSGGLATENKIPIVAIYSTFLQRAFDHIVHDISLQNLPVIFCLDRSGLVGEDGATHHGVLDIAYLRCIQNIIISAPKDGNELNNLLYTASLNEKTPFTIRYPKESSGVFDNLKPQKLSIGSWEVLSAGEDILILAVGSMVHKSLEICRKLAEKNITAEVVNCRFIKPMDIDYLNSSFKKFKKIVTIEEGVIDGGFGEGILNWSAKNNFSKDILTLGVPNRFVDHGPRDVLLEEIGLDSVTLYENIFNFIKKIND